MNKLIKKKNQYIFYNKKRENLQNKYYTFYIIKIADNFLE
jgi:hypothetical protein